jgi:hypothetical protein
VSPSANRAGWLAGVPLLLLACLVPPFVLFAPIAVAFAALAGFAIARWELLAVPVLVALLIAWPPWAVVLALGLAGGVALRLRTGGVMAGAIGAGLAVLILFGGYLNSREGPCDVTTALAKRYPQAVEFRAGESAWGQTCEAIGATGQVLGTHTYPERAHWLWAGVALVAPVGARRVWRATASR